MPEVEKRNYNERLFLGPSPPAARWASSYRHRSILIIYGLLTDTSVRNCISPDLFLADAGRFVHAHRMHCLFFQPEWDGDPVPQDLADKVRSLSGLLPPLGILPSLSAQFMLVSQHQPRRGPRRDRLSWIGRREQNVDHSRC